MLLHCVIPALITMNMVTCDMNLKSTQFLSEWRTEYVNRMLREVMLLPLQGKQIIFIVEENPEEFVRSSFLLSAAVTPYVIMSFPQHWKDADADFYHSIEFSKTWSPVLPMW